MTATNPENVHRKLSRARQMFHATPLKKTGKNTFAGYSYFEMGDFLVPALKIFDEVGLGTVTTFDRDFARMEVINLDCPSDLIEFQSPMGSANLKGCHEVQNIGAVETYQRRYLWTAVLEIVEHDALDATAGKPEPEEKPKRKAEAKVIDEGQLTELQTMFTHLAVPVAEFLAVAKIDRLDALPADWFERAKGWINQQAKAKRDELADDAAFLKGE